MRRQYCAIVSPPPSIFTCSLYESALSLTCLINLRRSDVGESVEWETVISDSNKQFIFTILIYLIILKMSAHDYRTLKTNVLVFSKDPVVGYGLSCKDAAGNVEWKAISSGGGVPVNNDYQWSRLLVSQPDDQVFPTEADNNTVFNSISTAITKADEIYALDSNARMLILVRPGTYTENVAVPFYVQLKAAENKTVATLGGSVQGKGVTIRGSLSVDATDVFATAPTINVEGFAIVASNDNTDPAVFIPNETTANLTLTNCVILPNDSITTVSTILVQSYNYDTSNRQGVLIMYNCSLQGGAQYCLSCAGGAVINADAESYVKGVNCNLTGSVNLGNNSDCEKRYFKMENVKWADGTLTVDNQNTTVILNNAQVHNVDITDSSSLGTTCSYRGCDFNGNTFTFTGSNTSHFMTLSKLVDCVFNSAQSTNHIDIVKSEMTNSTFNSYVGVALIGFCKIRNDYANDNFAWSFEENGQLGLVGSDVQMTSTGTNGGFVRLLANSTFYIDETTITCDVGSTNIAVRADSSSQVLKGGSISNTQFVCASNTALLSDRGLHLDKIAFDGPVTVNSDQVSISDCNFENTTVCTLNVNIVIRVHGCTFTNTLNINRSVLAPPTDNSTQIHSCTFNGASVNLVVFSNYDYDECYFANNKLINGSAFSFTKQNNENATYLLNFSNTDVDASQVVISNQTGAFEIFDLRLYNCKWNTEIVASPPFGINTDSFFVQAANLQFKCYDSYIYSAERIALKSANDHKMELINATLDFEGGFDYVANSVPRFFFLNSYFKLPTAFAINGIVGAFEMYHSILEVEDGTFIFNAFIPQVLIMEYCIVRCQFQVNNRFSNDLTMRNTVFEGAVTLPISGSNNTIQQCTFVDGLSITSVGDATISLEITQCSASAISIVKNVDPQISNYTMNIHNNNISGALTIDIAELPTSSLGGAVTNNYIGGNVTYAFTDATTLQIAGNTVKGKLQITLLDSNENIFTPIITNNVINADENGAAISFDTSGVSAGTFVTGGAHLFNNTCLSTGVWMDMSAAKQITLSSTKNEVKGSAVAIAGPAPFFTLGGGTFVVQ